MYIDKIIYHPFTYYNDYMRNRCGIINGVYNLRELREKTRCKNSLKHVRYRRKNGDLKLPKIPIQMIYGFKKTSRYYHNRYILYSDDPRYRPLPIKRKDTYNRKVLFKFKNLKNTKYIRINKKK